MKADCEIEGCNLPVFSRQWCQKHYARWLRHGDPTTTKAPNRGTGRRTRGENGYVYLRRPGHPLADKMGWVAEHRLVLWEAGRLEPGQVAHHRNGVKADNRLENLEALSRSEHSAEHAADRPTHCVHGHGYTEANSHYRKNGNRECRTCMRDRMRRRRAA